VFSKFFSRKISPPTFKEKVESFWQWFPTVAPDYARSFQNKQSPNADEIHEKVSDLCPGLAWVFGPGRAAGEHSFTITAEGNRHLQFLSQYWCSLAPQIAGWVFYPSRQPGQIGLTVLEIGGQKFQANQFWITPTPNDETEKVDLAVWHPHWQSLNHNDRWTALFILLDEALGEYATQQQIGHVDLSDRQLKDSFSLLELPAYLEKVTQEKDWDYLPPGEEAVLFQLKDPHDRFPRGDLLIGTTMHPTLLEDYLQAEGSLADPLLGSGATYVYLAIPMTFFPEGQEAETRGRIEDSLDAALCSQHSGRLLGGSLGVRNAYIDFILFDGSNSIELFRLEAVKLNLPAGTSLNHFCSGHKNPIFVL
jgi:hypothetical protein